MADKLTSQGARILDELPPDDQAAARQLFPILYGAFHDLAGRYLAAEKPGHTFSPTALVHEAYLKLMDQSRVQWRGKTHFFAVGAQTMRRILVDHARQRQRMKRGGGRVRIELNEQVALSPQRDEDLLAVDEALDKLARLDPRQAMIVELRFYGGMNVAEVAGVLGVSKRTVESEWTAVRAWLRRELSQQKTTT